MLLPISLEVFHTQVEKAVEVSSAPSSPNNNSSSDSDDMNIENESEQPASPFDCLFCPQHFQPSSSGLASNLSHMRQTHGLTIPNPELVTDMESFLGYLATQIHTWHECLHCGATRSSTRSIQNHMRDSGHCRLNFDKEPELIDFWEYSPPSPPPQPTPTSSATGMRALDGRVTESIQRTSPTPSRGPSRGPPRGQELTLTTPRPNPEDVALPAPLPPRTSTRQLGRRDEMALLGISPQQRSALMCAEKKAQRGEAAARKAREWVYAKGGNMQKHDQMDCSRAGKWGKQDHRLMPR